MAWAIDISADSPVVKRVPPQLIFLEDRWQVRGIIRLARCLNILVLDSYPSSVQQLSLISIESENSKMKCSTRFDGVGIAVAFTSSDTLQALPIILICSQKRGVRSEMIALSEKTDYSPGCPCLLIIMFPCW